MTDEMKLLRAFIEASGFDVETIRSLGPKTTFTGQQYTLPDNDGLCRQVIGGDYKVTKKRVGIKCIKCGTHIAHSSPLDSCLCKNSSNLIRLEHENI